MKRGTTPTLKVKINIDISQFSSVEFLFKQTITEEDISTSILKVYPTTQGLTYENGIFYIPFTEQETYNFIPNKSFYLDTRPITLTGSILATEIVEIPMNPTLFGEA